MKVLVDTSIWSQVLRKKNKNKNDLSISNELKELIYDFVELVEK